MNKLIGFLFLVILCLFTFSCSNSEDNGLVNIQLEDVTHNVIFWEYLSDTGNNTSKLSYNIQFNNPNNVDITGFYRITQNIDGLIVTRLSSDNAPCYSIEANSSCSVLFEEESSLDLGAANSVDLVSIEYNIEQ